MRDRLSERSLRYRAAIALDVRSAATKFRDNDQEASVATALHEWWSSGVRGPRFAQLIQRATEITQDRISLGNVQRGGAGRREAMPYFFEVLRELVSNERQAKRAESPR